MESDAKDTQQLGQEQLQQTDSAKLPKNTKANRYYYKNREAILEKKRQKRLEDPEYQAKVLEREEKKKAKEEEKKAKEEEKKAKEEETKRIREEEKRKRSQEKAKKKAALLGILPVILSGMEN